MVFVTVRGNVHNGEVGFLKDLRKLDVLMTKGKSWKEESVRVWRWRWPRGGFGWGCVGWV